MPRKRNEPAPAGEVEQTPPAEAGDVGGDLVDPENENSSEEVMVVVPTEELVRMGGHVLTEQGWVVEDALVTEDADVDPDEGEPAPETEQE